VTPPVVERACGHCGGSLAGKRSHAVYCSRVCKIGASDLRRKADGRARSRDRARYSLEAPARRAQAREQYEAHRERYLLASRAWRKANPGRRMIQNQARRTRKIGCPDSRPVTERDWRNMVRIYGARCAYCHADSPLTMDHVIPLARGGRHAIGNLVPACGRCNASKGAALLVEWRFRTRRGGESHPHPHQNVA
jgi:5-methylcytosine-specific restriction endonuclease McrA